jgi:hypothetical protein
VASVSIVMTAHNKSKAPPDLKPSRGAARLTRKSAGIDWIIAVAIWQVVLVTNCRV